MMMRRGHLESIMRKSIVFQLQTRNIRKQRVLVVGSGWAGYRLAADLKKDIYDVFMVSPRNHFLFTPLLPSTAVGTLEFRAIQEPVRTIPKINYFQAFVKNIDFENYTVDCVDAFKSEHTFQLKYDVVILAPGSETNTFGVKGIEDNPCVFFLKQLEHSRAIRNKLIECFERASSPSSTLEETKRLLTFVVVGGGPTNIEFAAELHDFIKKDVTRCYPDLRKYITITVIEASSHVLGNFHKSIVNYVESLFQSRDINVLTGVSVQYIDKKTVFLSNDQSISFGLLVWSTGVKQTALISEISPDIVAKSRQGRLKIDNQLRVLAKDKRTPIYNGSVYAMGDCAGDVDKPLPALAQVALQQAKYLAKSFNNYGVGTDFPKGFLYSHLGSMASVGMWKGVYDSTNIGPAGSEVSGPPINGFLAFILWRSAYWTKQVSLVNKILIPMYWFKSILFGRDVSRF
eukprot:gene5445-10937_t